MRGFRIVISIFVSGCTYGPELIDERTESHHVTRTVDERDVVSFDYERTRPGECGLKFERQTQLQRVLRTRVHRTELRERFRIPRDDGDGDWGAWVLMDVLQGRWVFAPFVVFYGLSQEDPRSLYALAPVDAFGRLAGGGLRHWQDPGTEHSPAQVPRLLKNNYARNVLDWFGWFIPGYPVVHPELVTLDSRTVVSDWEETPDGDRYLRQRPTPHFNIAARFEVKVNGSNVSPSSVLPGFASVPIPDSTASDAVEIRVLREGELIFSGQFDPKLAAAKRRASTIAEVSFEDRRSQEQRR